MSDMPYGLAWGTHGRHLANGIERFLLDGNDVCRYHYRSNF